MDFLHFVNWFRHRYKSIKWSFIEISTNFTRIYWIFSGKKFRLKSIRALTRGLHTAFVHQFIHKFHFVCIHRLVLGKSAKFFVILKRNTIDCDEWLMKFSFFFRLTQQQNDKFKRLSSRYPRHVLASIQKAWRYSTFNIHESL